MHNYFGGTALVPVRGALSASAHSKDNGKKRQQKFAKNNFWLMDNPKLVPCGEDSLYPLLQLHNACWRAWLLMVKKDAGNGNVGVIVWQRSCDLHESEAHRSI